MADTHNQAEVKTNYPVSEGLLSTDNHKGRKQTLIPTMGSLIPKRYKVGIKD